jgi:hypothetical protein
MHESLQSSYKCFHSTETALLKVQNYVLRNIDEKNCVALVLLDLSAAFDTIDHDILLSRLSNRFGVKGNALAWFESYLSNRTQAVFIDGKTSKRHVLKYGVPQGSVLGPILFISYTAPLGDIVRKHNLMMHLYADDTQIYLAFKPQSSAIAVSMAKIEACISDIRKWMATNFLMLNDTKTEFLILGTSHQLKKVPKTCLHIGNDEIESCDSARNIGAIFNSTMNLEKHVNTICRAAWYHLRNIGLVRKYLNQAATETLVHAFITSKLDHMNSLLINLPSVLLNKLQKVQNAAARMVVRAKKFQHISPHLIKLHWLPVRQRIAFKVLLITYKALNDQGPSYIREMLTLYAPSRALRSENQYMLDKPRTNSTYGDRSFSAAAPALWNDLPLTIRQSPSTEVFKNRLKTHLFNKYFNVSD